MSQYLSMLMMRYFYYVASGLLPSVALSPRYQSVSTLLSHYNGMGFLAFEALRYHVLFTNCAEFAIGESSILSEVSFLVSPAELKVYRIPMPRMTM